MSNGLNTGLKPTFGIRTAKNGSDNLKGFLTLVGKPSQRRLSNADAPNAQSGRQVKSTKFFKDWKNPDVSVFR